MNTSSLARQYDALSPWERLPLVIAAVLRKDAVEERRLAQSASRKWFCIKDYWILTDGLISLAQSYVMRQLDFACCFGRLIALLENSGCVDDEENEEQDEGRWRVIKLAAHHFFS